MPKVAEHYEWIDEMSAEFQGWVDGLMQTHLSDGGAWSEMNLENGNKVWQLRILLAIAQQLSIISQQLKSRS